MTHAEKAEQAFLNGANCAQAVVSAFRDDLGMDESTALKLASSFGGGIGRMREVCGAVSGMLMVYGLIKGYDDLLDPTAKKSHYENVQALVHRFEEIHGSHVCRELLNLQKGEKTNPQPSERTEHFYHARPCASYVVTAANLLDAALQKD